MWKRAREGGRQQRQAECQVLGAGLRPRGLERAAKGFTEMYEVAL